MSLLQSDSDEKVVRRPEGETHLAKYLKLHDLSTLCLTEYLKCFPSVALVGCCSCLLTAECYYPVTFA